MRTAVINATELSTKSLRASDYVASPRRLATNAVQTWAAEYGHVVNCNSKAGKSLIAHVERAIRAAMEKK